MYMLVLLLKAVVNHTMWIVLVLTLHGIMFAKVTVGLQAVSYMLLLIRHYHSKKYEVIIMDEKEFCDGCCYRRTCDHDLEKCCYLIGQNRCILDGEVNI